MAPASRRLLIGVDIASSIDIPADIRWHSVCLLIPPMRDASVTLSVPYWEDLNFLLGVPLAPTTRTPFWRRVRATTLGWTNDRHRDGSASSASSRLIPICRYTARVCSAFAARSRLSLKPFSTRTNKPMLSKYVNKLGTISQSTPAVGNYFPIHPQKLGTISQSGLQLWKL